jgi:choline-glycine betaine transporter
MVRVAGADAGTIVLGSMSGGVLEPSRLIKLTWGAIMAATPFAAILLWMCWSLLKAMSEDVAAGGDHAQVDRSHGPGLPAQDGRPV